MRSTRRHARARWTGGSVRIALVVGLAVAALGGGAAYAAYRYDQATMGRALPGVEVSGVRLDGMTRGEAIAAVEGVASQYLDHQVEVQARDRTWHVTPAELGTTADVEAKVDRALAAADTMPWPVRVFHRMLGRPVEESFSLEYTYDQKRIRRFVKTVARSVNVDPRNAEVTFEDGELVLRKPKLGHALAMKRSQQALLQALKAPELDVVELAVRKLRPEIGKGDLGHTIVVRLGELRLYLYDGLRLVKTYPVAAGQSAYPTPTGTWTIVNKAENPTWVNPAPDGWGAGLPKVVGPGPGNPLGTHALYLDAPGIRIHGTYASSSIGTYASHGCIRMQLDDVKELFSTVGVGTPVYVYW